MSAAENEAIDRGVMFQAYLESIKPFIEIKCDIFSSAMPTKTPCEGALVEYQYCYTKEQKELIATADRRIDQIRRVFFET